MRKLDIEKRTREQVLMELQQDSATWELFGKFKPEHQEELLGFCMGEQGLSVTYDAVFKKIFDPASHPERLEQFISDVLGEKVKIVEVLQNQGIIIQEDASFVIMDVVVELEDGTLMNVEMQKYGYNFPAERTDCYLADLIMRQYSDMKKKQGKDFQFRDMSKVVAIVIMEQSPREFHQWEDRYVHHGEMVYDSGIRLRDLFESTYVCLDVFKKKCHTEVRNRKEAWMRFLGSREMKDIVEVCEKYPEFIPLYEEVFRFKRNVKELVRVFSEALAVMTKNTERYMVEELQKEVDRKDEEIEKQAGALAKKDKEIEKQAGELENYKKRILELEQMLTKKEMEM